jgi:nitroimidazol reductase NimA-like FMN-containing flavoprotein (pyridoxamine 5'-phosphate oxidase superfamily)
MARRPPRLTKAVEEFIRRERVCRVATADAEGRPHVVPVCHVLERGRIYFGSGKDAGKVQNLSANPRIAVAVDAYTDAWNHLRGVMVRGRTRLIARGPEFRRFRAALYAKYQQYKTDSALGESDSRIVEVTPEHVFHWGFD